MVIARAVEFYLEYAEEILTIFQCTPKDKDINAERRALMKVGDCRVSVFRSAELPEPDRGLANRFPTYTAMLKAMPHPPKKPKLPGLRISKHKRAAVERLLKERVANGKSLPSNTHI